MMHLFSDLLNRNTIASHFSCGIYLFLFLLYCKPVISLPRNDFIFDFICIEFQILLNCLYRRMQ